MRPIDADALMERMYRDAFENDASYNERDPMAKWDSGLWIRYKMFENAIDDAPTIDADRPKGEWIMHIDDLFPCESTQECSVCHAEQLINGNDDNFCPNCGARMKGADDE